ncbi:MAG: hypothetical protein IBX64_03570 [Actinobacteria bacterium]|nr:hypothetical protein [Actinomycetota bacterium]
MWVRDHRLSGDRVTWWPGYRVIIAATLLTVMILIQAASAFAVVTQSDWATLETPHFKIHASKRASIEDIGRVAEAVYVDMAARYNHNQAQKIDLYIYTDRSAFLAGSPSANAAGYAQPSRNLIAVLQGVGNSTVILAHEINHIIFTNSVPRLDTVPRWFVEGLAIHESQPGIEAARLEKYALAKDIHDFLGPAKSSWDEPARPQDYAQGYLMVNFITDKFGEAKLYEVIGRLQAGEVFDSALIRALGSNQDELNAEWKDYARGQIISIWLMQLRDIGWYLMGALIILAIIIAPIRKRRRLREMEDEDWGEPAEAQSSEDLHI